MKKSYLDELVEWGAENPVKNQSKLAEFLSVKDDVKAALNAGHEISQTWRHMRATGRITISKNKFYIYVHRYIRQAADKDEKGKAADSSPPKEKPAAEKTPEVKTAKGDDSQDSEKAERELEPWVKSHKGT